jgi:DNA polymerase I-like protein with 3'-5' exonuclease and polymerase domains
MLKIRHKTIQKQVTLDDFMRLKKDGATFETMRQNAKGVNFAFLFGATASTFARLTLEARWSEADADAYISEHKLFRLKEKIISRYPRESPLMWKYMTCATDIRDKFFKTYPGLMKRIERERKFAIQHGYVRSWHGACRRIPELFLADRDDNGKLSGDDQKLYGRQIGNLLNIAANTSIQNYEAVLVMDAIVQIVEEFKEKKMKSYVFGSVHDSIDLVIHKEEVTQAAEIIRRVCTADRPEAYGMPQDVDMIIADIVQGEYYKGGKDVSNYI